VGVVIHTERIGQCVEEKCNGRTRSGRDRIGDGGRILVKFEEGVWQRERGISKDGRIEKVGTRRKNNGGVCAGV